jgi:hypothetical protein
MYKVIDHCRVSKSSSLKTILDLGNQYLSGVFPKSKNQEIGKAPLELVWCNESKLAQLKHSYSLNQLYGDNYGYRSGLNMSMVEHLNQKIKKLEDKVQLKTNDLVIDIGSNDATTLKAYKDSEINKVGIDPTGKKFKRFYNKDISLISDFFPTPKLQELFPSRKAKIITSIAMFYDLEDPTLFVEAIANNLDLNGIWHFEQSYLPIMLEKNSYDTICHEHLEYYTIESIILILEKYDLKIIDIELNSINGGSFALSVTHKDCKKYEPNENYINRLLDKEKRLELSNLLIFREFEKNVVKHKKDLKKLINNINNDGKKVLGYGASTKGNVLLQYCGITKQDIPFIAEVNEDKFGAYTPGSLIPIIPEEKARSMHPDFFFVLPWHFRDSILAREQEFMSNGGKFIFPLPYIDIV